jgi:hypothetical protein
MDIEQLAGTRLGKYEIESPIGRGGMIPFTISFG